TSVFACGGGGGRGGIGGIHVGGGGYGGNGGTCNNGGVYGNNNGGYNNYGQAYEPFHSSYVVQPGDSFYTVALKEYGTSSTMNQIARFNRLSTNVALVPGQRLLLPSITANGQLTQSRAPAAEVFNNVAASAVTTTTTAPAMTSANVAAAIAPAPAPEPTRMSVPTGSTLQLDGQTLGSETGVARLRISGVAFPVEVVEWNADSTKIRLPKLDVGSATKAELEVLRADGTLASTNAIELTAPATGLAATN
ncbi:MAG: LysM domain-containing protein, partial [Pirellulales bacterium]